MRLRQPAAAPRGSFGIPDEIHPEKVAQKKAEHAAQHEATVDAAQKAAPSVDDNFDIPGDASAEDAPVEETGPAKVLSDMGIELTADDWSDFYFRGSMEKDLVVAEIPQADGSLLPLTITVRTLTAAEYDTADSLLATEIQSLPMTQTGLENRRQMWEFSFAVQKINGRALTKTVTKTDRKTKETNPDVQATAKARRAVLAEMNASVLSMALIKYGEFVRALTQIAQDPTKNFFVKP